MNINLLQEAEEEFKASASYYELQHSGLGMEFIKEVERPLQLIYVSPLQSLKVRKNIRRRIVRRFPFIILYHVFNESIDVIAIAHQRRRPGYWKERVK